MAYGKSIELFLANGTADNLVTAELSNWKDILFSSSSAAADFALGYSVSGPATWKTKTGTTLKELETMTTQ